MKQTMKAILAVLLIIGVPAALALEMTNTVIGEVKGEVNAAIDHMILADYRDAVEPIDGVTIVKSGSRFSETPDMLYLRSCVKATAYVNDWFAHIDHTESDYHINTADRDSNDNIICTVDLVEKKIVHEQVSDSGRMMTTDVDGNIGIDIIHSEDFSREVSRTEKVYTMVDLSNYTAPEHI